VATVIRHWGLLFFAVVASILLPSEIAVAIPCGQLGNVPVCTIVNSPNEFIASAGGVAGLRLIDFETGPDGLPSYPGEIITPSFNYTNLGVMFNVPTGVLRIVSSAGTRSLDAETPPPFTPTWIEASFVYPTNGAGIWYPGGTTLYAYDSENSLLGQVSYSAPGGKWFLGIISDTPIARIVANRNGGFESIADFVFNTPEPTTISLLSVGMLMLICRRARAA
jgi:hypothetical protein